MKVGVWKLIEGLLNENRTFSSSLASDIYTYRTKDITYAEKENERKVATQQMMPLMIHLIMYCYPDAYIGSIEKLKSNEDEIMKKWLRKISTEMLKYEKTKSFKKRKFTPMQLEVEFTSANAKTMKENLEKHHGYRNAILTDLLVNEVQRIFLSSWDTVINKNITIGNISVPDSELLEILRSTKNDVLRSVRLKGFRINRANIFR